MDNNPNTGFDMWREYTLHYGTAAAYCICWRYLDMQTQTEDKTEREFCRQLRSAWEAEPTLTDVSIYQYAEAFAKLDGSIDKYNESLQANIKCVSDIGDVVNACKYGDGSVDYATALKALMTRYGMDRLRLVLGCEIRHDHLESYPDELHKWAEKMNIPEGFVNANIRMHPEYLTGLINEVIKQENIIQRQGGLSLKNKNDFYVAFYEQLALQGFQAKKSYDKNNIADICVNGYSVAHLTKSNSIEQNPCAEGVEADIIEKIRGIMKDTALGIHTEHPNDETRRLLFTEKEMTTIHNALTSFVMMPDNDLGFDDGQEVDNIIYKIEAIMPELAGLDISSDLENDADMSEGVEP